MLVVCRVCGQVVVAAAFYGEQSSLLRLNTLQTEAVFEGNEPVFGTMNEKDRRFDLSDKMIRPDLVS